MVVLQGGCVVETKSGLHKVTYGQHCLVLLRGGQKFSAGEEVVDRGGCEKEGGEGRDGGRALLARSSPVARCV